MKIHDPHKSFDDELVSAYLDNELSPEERAKMERRLAADPAARKLLEELQSVSQAVRQLPLESLGEDLRASILQRAQRAKLAKTETPVYDALVRRADNPPASRRWTIGRTRRGWIWAGMAIAASLLIMVLRPDEANQNAGPELIAARSAPPENAPSAGFEFRAEESGGAAVASRPDDNLTRRSYGELLDQSSSGADSPSPMLVVFVCARPEAIRNRTIDEVLLNNQIYLENGLADEAERAAVTEENLAEKKSAATQDLARAYRVPQQQANSAAVRLNVPFRGGLEQSKSEAASQELAVQSEPSRRGREGGGQSIPSEVDVVLVEAPLSQVVGCLSGIQADAYNYRCVEVEEPVDLEKTTRSDAKVNWQQYNRSRALDETGSADSSGTWSFGALQQQPAAAGARVESDSRSGVSGGAVEQTPLGRSSVMPSTAGKPPEASGREPQLTNAKEVVDEALQQSFPLVASRKLKLAKNAVQVLLVLSADPPAPAAASPADSTQPSAPATEASDD